MAASSVLSSSIAYPLSAITLQSWGDSIFSVTLSKSTIFLLSIVELVFINALRLTTIIPRNCSRLADREHSK